jgi:hypothetical protein
VIACGSELQSLSVGNFDLMTLETTQSGFPRSSFPQVRLLEGPLRDRQIVNGDHLRAIDADRLLAVYRRDCGLPKKAKTYGGWEARGIGGHILGIIFLLWRGIALLDCG